MLGLHKHKSRIKTSTGRVSMDSVLDRVQCPEDLKKLDEGELGTLCQEIRKFLIENIAKTGGHLASNLGVVELTVALHRVFSPPNDQIVFDVGHQSYVHKLITGRRGQFSTLRSYGGLSGFPKPDESVYDAFATGHSSTSVSAALGLACADKLCGRKRFTVAVLGDGALTGGLAFEGLSNAGRSNARIIVILNDNDMSISRNVGGVAKYLARVRHTGFYYGLKDLTHHFLDHVPFIGKRIARQIHLYKSALKISLYHTTFFEDLGFTYYGPIDGHDLPTLCKVLERARSQARPTFIHIHTTKGKGYPLAEQQPDLYHGISGMDNDTGMAKPQNGRTFTDVFSKAICDAAAQDERICAITAAMASGTGLAAFSERFRARFFDVGIAEQHAVTFAAGLAKNGMLPVVAVYSTFLQRAYDQIVHDAALQRLKVVLAIDRAGLAGEDGETHQGLFDTSYLNGVPGLTVLAPATFAELLRMFPAALYRYSGVTAVRYPRGGQPAMPVEDTYGDALREYWHFKNHDDSRVLLVSYGRAVANCLDAARLLAEKGRPADVLKLNVIKPLPPCLNGLLSSYERVVFAEEGMRGGGIAESFGALYSGVMRRYNILAVKDYVPHGSIPQLMAHCGLHAEGIAGFVLASE